MHAYIQSVASNMSQYKSSRNTIQVASGETVQCDNPACKRTARQKTSSSASVGALYNATSRLHGFGS